MVNPLRIHSTRLGSDLIYDNHEHKVTNNHGSKWLDQLRPVVLQQSTHHLVQKIKKLGLFKYESWWYPFLSEHDIISC